jgi:hypothetical protein
MPFDDLELIYRLSSWNGLPVRRLDVPVSELRGHLPDFELRPLGTPPNDNPRMRLIVRMPEKDDPHERPVAAVSERYDLLQHRVVASWLHENTREAGLKDVIASVVITQYGERMRITIPLEDRSRDVFDEDKYRPEIEVTNSVDKSSAFRVAIRWRRLVCLNGMFTMQEDRMRSVHHVDLSRTHLVRAFLEERLGQNPDVLERLRTWQETDIAREDVQAWCEDRLRKRRSWSVENCARLWAILETGYDGRVYPPRRVGERQALSAYRVGQDKRVPMVDFPVTTACGVAQILTWITTRQRSVEMQLEGAEEVPQLVDDLVAFAGKRDTGR